MARSAATVRGELRQAAGVAAQAIDGDWCVHLGAVEAKRSRVLAFSITCLLERCNISRKVRRFRAR